jgi:hypothetical protein
MANRIEFAVSATPIKSTTFEIDYDSDEVADTTAAAHDYIEPNIGKTLGGNGTISGIAATVVGYGNATNGVPDYLVTSSSVITLAITAQDLLFIKNPGLKSDGTAGTATVAITIKITSSPTDTIGLCTLGVGEAIILPTVPAGTTYTFTASSGDCKIEYATIT